MQNTYTALEFLEMLLYNTLPNGDQKADIKIDDSCGQWIQDMEHRQKSALIFAFTGCKMEYEFVDGLFLSHSKETISEELASHMFRIAVQHNLHEQFVNENQFSGKEKKRLERAVDNYKQPILIRTYFSAMFKFCQHVTRPLEISFSSEGLSGYFPLHEIERHQKEIKQLIRPTLEILSLCIPKQNIYGKELIYEYGYPEEDVQQVKSAWNNWNSEMW